MFSRGGRSKQLLDRIGERTSEKVGKTQSVRETTKRSRKNRKESELRGRQAHTVLPGRD